MRVTLDTNVLTSQAVQDIARARGFEISVVSVTRREVENTQLSEHLEPLGEVPETMVWDESRWGEAVWGSDDSADLLQAILRVMAGGGWPDDPKDRTEGHQRQLRDAMILESHVREGRDLLVTNDRRAFIRSGRRDELESLLATRIMTEQEFISAYAEP